MKKLISFVLLLCVLLSANLGAAEMMIANPWVETTPEELVQVLGLTFGVPEDAEEVVYRMLESEQLAEMQFAWRGAKCAARIKSAAEWEDISGLNYDMWTSEESCEIGWCEGKIVNISDEEKNIQLCLWFDIAPGLMYSSVMEFSEGDAMDVLELAELIYIPAQGDVD